MLDLRLIREDAEAVAKALARRGVPENAIHEVVDLDIQRRAAQTRLDEARSEQKVAGRDVATLKGDEKRALLARLKGLSSEIADLERLQAESASALNNLLLNIPNVPHESVPDGVTEEDNVVVREHGAPPSFDFEARDHLDIGEALDVIDMERGARMSGSRFSVLKGKGMLLWMALSRFAIETVAKHGHTPVLPPVLVRREAMEGTGFIPAGEDQIYRLPADELYLVGTAEVPLAALHMGEILDASALPLRYVGQSACFRREAGALGKDTRGIFRNHQFEKVEMFVFTTADQSWEEHERMLAIEEEILTALGLPYRVVALCTGDLGAPSAKTYDCEVWFPAQGKYREITSCSNTTDYQARRLNCRIKADKGTTFVHTLNGTAVTSSRHVAAILENFQREDGSVVVPEVLRTYTGFDAIA